METTQLYIELIIIGLEAFIWMCTFLINIIGNKVAGILVNILDNFSSSLLLIGILYVIGILIDRFADIIFQKREDILRNKSGLQAKSSILVWKKYNVEKYAEYSRTRVRILRTFASSQEVVIPKKQEKKYKAFTEAEANQINLQELLTNIKYQLDIADAYGTEVLFSLLEKARQQAESIYNYMIVNMCLALASCCQICYIKDRKRESHRSGSTHTISLNLC